MQKIKLNGDWKQDDTLGILFLTIAIFAALAISMMYTQHLLTTATSSGLAVGDAGGWPGGSESVPTVMHDARIDSSALVASPGCVER